MKKYSADEHREKLDTFFLKTKIDLNGHHYPTTYLKEEIKSSFSFAYRMIISEFDDIPAEQSLKEGKEKAAYITCDVCGKRIPLDLLPGSKKFLAKDKCPYTNNFPEIKANLKVPSGNIVISNDLRSLYPLNEKKFHNVCTMQGIADYTEDYSKTGLITHFLSNTCPDIFLLNSTTIQIGNNLKGKIVGNVCTDLWWYCAVDLEDLKKRFNGPIDKLLDKFYNTVIIPVKPGIYETIGSYHISKKLFSTIKWIDTI